MAPKRDFRSTPNNGHHRTGSVGPVGATNGLMHRSKYRGRNLEAERLGCLEVDDQLEFGGLFDGEVGGFGTFEDPLTHTGSN
jgi:hypothetical protein